MATPHEAVAILADAFEETAPEFPVKEPARRYLMEWTAGETHEGKLRSDVLATTSGEVALEKLAEVISGTAMAAAVTGLSMIAEAVTGEAAEELLPEVLAGIRPALNLSRTILCD
jgi:hypothetical protein